MSPLRSILLVLGLLLTVLLLSAGTAPAAADTGTYREKRVKAPDRLVVGHEL